MRIISGVVGGRKLRTLAGLNTRPTSDKVKGAIFSVLGPKVRGARVLDLFAGSGALALEALSRGAEFALAVDKSGEACEIIKANSRELGLLEKMRISCGDGLTCLKGLTEQFDLMFLDPPYRQELASKCLEILSSGNYLSNNGVIILETSREEEIPVEIGKISLRKRSSYGDTVIWYFQLTETEGKEH